jgi:hypothetical protein
MKEEINQTLGILTVGDGQNERRNKSNKDGAFEDKAKK